MNHRFEIVTCHDTFPVCGFVTEDARTNAIPYCRRIAQFRLKHHFSKIGDISDRIAWDQKQWLIVQRHYYPDSNYAQLLAVYLAPIPIAPLGEGITAYAYEPVEISGMNSRTEDMEREGPFAAVIGPPLTTTDAQQDLVLPTVTRSLYCEREIAIKFRENWHIQDGKRRWKINSVTGTADVTRLPVVNVQESDLPQ